MSLTTNGAAKRMECVSTEMCINQIWVGGASRTFLWETRKPDGKLMDGTRLANRGWKARLSLKDGVAHAHAYASFLAEKANGTLRS